MDELLVFGLLTVGFFGGSALGFFVGKGAQTLGYECTQTEVIKGEAVCTALELKRKK